MSSAMRFESDEHEDDDLSGARRNGPPERSNRRAQVPQSPKRARRNKSADVAKRGMHQRRNKRVAW